MRARKSTPPSQSPTPAADPGRRDLERRVRELTAVNDALTVELTHRDARESAVRLDLERRVEERSALLEAEKRVLELVSSGAGLSAVLEELCRAVERLTGMVCAVLLPDDDGVHLPHGAATRGLLACWSTPIPSAGGQVLGTIALYYHEHRRPTDDELRLIDRFVYLAGIAIERTRAQEAIAERERRFRAIFETEPECVKILTPGNVLLAMNPAGLAMIEADHPKQVLGTSVLTLVAPEHRDAFAELTRRAAQGEPGVLEFEIIGLKGTRRWMETHAVPLQRGTDGPVDVLSVTRDITERKRTEQALQASESRFRMLVEQAVDGITVIADDGRFVMANSPYCDMLGYSPYEILQLNMCDTYAPDEHDLVRSRMDQVRAGQLQRFERRARRKDGSYILVEVNTRSLPGGGFQAFVRDITERKRAEQVARRSREQLQALSHRLLEAREVERRHIAHGLHDELGQTLTAIKLNLQSLRADADPVAESLALIDRGIEQVRSLSLDLRPSMLDDLGLVATLRWYLDRHGQRAGYAVTLDADRIETRLPPTVETACFRLTQEALTNVARHARARRVTVTVRGRDAELELAVRDDGVGFDVRAARERAAAGASLGLLGMEELASLAGGRLTIESAPGQGTAILARFPLREDG